MGGGVIPPNPLQIPPSLIKMLGSGLAISKSTLMIHILPNKLDSIWSLIKMPTTVWGHAGTWWLVLTETVPLWQQPQQLTGLK